jgi:hypothetical protein
MWSFRTDVTMWPSVKDDLSMMFGPRPISLDSDQIAGVAAKSDRYQVGDITVAHSVDRVPPW